MAFAAAILGWLVLGALALVLLVLVVPWSVTLAGATHPARIRVELRPVSHRVPLRLRVEREVAADLDAVPDPPPVPDRPAPEARKRGRGKGSRRTARALRAAPRLFLGLLSVFRFERVRLSGRLGLADPADTGQVFGLILPLAAVFNGPRVEVDIEPDFTGPVLQGAAEASTRIHLVRAIPPAIRFLWRVYGAPA